VIAAIPSPSRGRKKGPEKGDILLFGRKKGTFYFSGLRGRPRGRA
jgi:hypothetical protein